DPQQPDRALLGVAPDLHGMGRGRPVGDHDRVDVPQLGQLADVRLVVPVAEAGQVAVGAGLAGVLGGRLPVHLGDAAAGPPDHAADQVEVVDLAGGRGRAHRLVDALEHG